MWAEVRGSFPVPTSCGKCRLHCRCRLGRMAVLTAKDRAGDDPRRVRPIRPFTNRRFALSLQTDGIGMSAKFMSGTRLSRAPHWIALACGVALCCSAAAQPPGDFYRGKTVNLLVGSGEGGGFDLSARLTAQFLNKYILGSPTIVVQNMPGAAGLRVAEYMYTVAPRDGTVIAITQPSMVQHKVLNSSARFNPAEYTWIGRLGGFVTYGVVWHTAPVQTIEQAKQRELILGAVG